MEVNLAKIEAKENIFNELEASLGRLALTASSSDFDRPWGGFFVVDEQQTGKFTEIFFPELTVGDIQRAGNKLSPKLLAVEPGKRLSWQYHRRRAELWRVIAGPVGVITSDDDAQRPVTRLESGDIVQFDAFVRHRLVGVSNWGVVAEIWQHTDPSQPSDESDIVRIEDDFGR